jgi:hypothetical protein
MSPKPGSNFSEPLLDRRLLDMRFEVFYLLFPGPIWNFRTTGIILIFILYCSAFLKHALVPPDLLLGLFPPHKIHNRARQLQDAMKDTQ